MLNQKHIEVNIMTRPLTRNVLKGNTVAHTTVDIPRKGMSTPEMESY